MDSRFARLMYCRDWRDPSWSGLTSVQNGLQQTVRQQRHALFGNNEVDIEGKSTVSLLVNEVRYRYQGGSITNIGLGYSPVLCLPNCQCDFVVAR